jgi:hypothetical protein
MNKYRQTPMIHTNGEGHLSLCAVEEGIGQNRYELNRYKLTRGALLNFRCMDETGRD